MLTPSKRGVGGMDVTLTGLALLASEIRPVQDGMTIGCVTREWKAAEITHLLLASATYTPPVGFPGNQLQPDGCFLCHHWLGWVSGEPSGLRPRWTSSSGSSQGSLGCTFSWQGPVTFFKLWGLTYQVAVLPSEGNLAPCFLVRQTFPRACWEQCCPCRCLVALEAWGIDGNC